MDDKLNELWESGTEVQSWGDGTNPNEDLIYRSGHTYQVKSIQAIAHLSGTEVRVVGEHTSKSVGLPVAMFRLEYSDELAYVFMRDNFYDIKLVVQSSAPVDSIPYQLIFWEMGQEGYDKEKKRARGYMGDGKAKMYTTDEWFSSWCNDNILRAEDTIFRVPGTDSVYCEGINTLAVPLNYQRYEHGRSEFALGAIINSQVAMVLKYIDVALQKEEFRKSEERAAQNA